jgi:hypothetical protein
LIQTNAMMWAEAPNGWAVGRAPMPAPFWLHQSPRNGRWSILFAATYAVAVVGVLFSAVGRFGPPVQAVNPCCLSLR